MKNEDKKEKDTKEIKEIKEVRLKVVEALQDDAYKGIARIDPLIMRALGLNRGDVILVKGQRETVAIVDRAYPADVGEGIIRIDGLARRNAKTSVGEIVTVKKANTRPIERVVLTPILQPGMHLRIQGDVGPMFLGRAVSKGDIISFGGQNRRREEAFGGDLSDIFGALPEELFGGMGLPMFNQQQIKFIVTSIVPNQAGVITEKTDIQIGSKGVEVSEEEASSVPQVTYEDIGGLTEEVKKIREMVELPLKHPEIFDKLGIEPPKGVLLYGPPGTGKTLLAKAVANESEAHFISVSGPEIFDKFYGESEKNIKKIFDDAEKNAPSIIFFDEIDSIAPGRDQSIHSGEVERRVVSQLLSMMDGLKSRGKVVVIAATNRPDSIDSALRRPGRFDREIEINVPNKEGRLNILKIHSRNMPLAKNVDLNILADKTHGFVGADLAALAKEAAMSVLRKVSTEFKLDGDDAVPKEALDKLIIRAEDFDEALKFVQPSALREVAVEIPNVKWTDVGGLDKVKAALKEAVEWPMKFSSSFANLGIRAPKGILLYGPPGTGKTLLAKAVATECGANFIQVNGNELQKEGIVGRETERLRKMFKRAKQVSPSILFFDEFDSFARSRGAGTGGHSESNESLLNTLLTEMDGLQELKNVTIIAATNRPDILDQALLRPGRFDRMILVDVPDEESRRKIFEVHLRNTPIEKDVDLTEIVKQTEGFVGSDIEGLVREASMNALRRDMNSKVVTKVDFDEAFKKSRVSVSLESAKRYKKLEEHYLKNAKIGVETGPIYTG